MPGTRATGAPDASRLVLFRHETAMPPNIADAAIAASPSRFPCALPPAAQLAALGKVLCVHRPHGGGELAGWTQAVGVEFRVGIDSDGCCEALWFRDRAGQCCWRLYLLPDSDFLAWERLRQRVPLIEPVRDCIAQRLWRRLSARMAGERWQCSVLRLHALKTNGPTLLAASAAVASSLGMEVVRRVARVEGFDGEIDLHAAGVSHG